MDLEASCDEGISPKVTRKNQEIIELPWIVYDLKENVSWKRRRKTYLSLERNRCTAILFETRVYRRVATILHQSDWNY